VWSVGLQVVRRLVLLWFLGRAGARVIPRVQLLADLSGALRCLPQRPGLRPRERRWYMCIISRAANVRRG
jgi:hypothetical protein